MANVKVPKESGGAPKRGVAGENVPKAPTPPLPKHFGGSGGTSSTKGG